MINTIKTVLTDAKMPFCPGCGHGPAVKAVSKSLIELGFGTKDVIIVSDIGCAGLIDPLFATHTIHGLHGRAPALGMGVSLGLSDLSKKVVVIQGDGGATIGLQHIMEAARQNIDMTLVILNNLLYGMTGGQMSGLSTQEFKEYKLSADGADPYDVVNLAHHAGASLSMRVSSIKEYKNALKEAFSSRGFSLVELSSLCTSHAMKKLAEFQEYTEDEDRYVNDRPAGVSMLRNTKPLFENAKGLEPKFSNNIQGQVGVVIAGSAGGGVQSAAKLLAQAGILAGLNTTMKGEYPITVGTGFSVAEVIFSKEPINYTGLERPDSVLVVTDNGWNKVKNRITDNSLVFLDDKIETDTDFETKSFFKTSGKRGAALNAVAYWLRQSGVIPVEALMKVAHQHKYGESLVKSILDSEELG